MTRQVSNRSVFIFAVLILLTIYGADNVEPLSIGPNPVAVSEGEDPPEPTDPPKIPMSPIVFEVTLTNLTEGVPGEGGQIFSPPILITHGYGFSIGASGEPASAALTTLAETGDHGPLLELATKSSGVETIAGFLPPPDGVVLPGESVTAPVLATSEAHYLSLATMLVQTNDGIVLANALPLVDGKGNPQTITMDLIAYDAGTEDNNELATHVPGPPFHGMERAPTEGGVIAPHTGIGGTADVGVEFGWTEPVARVTVSVVELDTVEPIGTSNYTFESIEVPGVDFLELTASSDFEDYAGNTLSADGEKTVAFTLIDGVFNTYDFPGSNNTYFYALGNDGSAAGHYEDSDGLHHGVILENGELRQYDFPGAVQTEIYGISDATGALTGNFIDASGVRRGFSGDLSLEFPDAVATYADFVNASGIIVGSYIDSAGIYHAYGHLPDGRFVAGDILTTSDLEFLFLHGVNDIGVIVARSKVVEDVPRTYVGVFGDLEELRFPGSVSTEGWNINQDSSVVGNYVTADGRRHGFIAKPVREISHDTVAPPIDFDYTFERIEVPGVDFLELTASNDFEDYAGNTLSADGEKMVGFTLIHGVFNTYDFPGSKNTYFYAIGNSGLAAGYYEDSSGLHHGVILENGELRQYDFPDAVETFIYGVSDETGALTGSWIDASGVRRGFTGDTIIEGPGATATYAYAVNTHGEVVGSYVDPEGLYHAFVRSPDNKYTSPPTDNTLEFYFIHQINDAGVYVGRSKAVGDVPRTYFGSLYIGTHELQFPDSVSTEGWNINQDGSIVGYYDTADGRRHGFVARPAVATDPGVDPVKPFETDLFEMALAKGLNMISLPLMPLKPYTARTFAEMLDATVVIRLDTDRQEFVGFTADQSGEGYPIEGGQGYIVNVPGGGTVTFEGTAWSNTIENTAAAPGAELSSTGWAFVVSGDLHETELGASYTVVATNRRTGEVVTRQVLSEHPDFNVVWADLSRQPVIESGDTIEIALIDQSDTIVSGPFRHRVGVEDLQKAYVSLSLTVGDVHPTETLLGQNFPNPFNPETWIPYQLESSADVVFHIYDTSGRIVRTIDLGFKPQGFYTTRSTAAYWDGRNNIGEPVASGVYFYSLRTADFSATRKMLILK